MTEAMGRTHIEGLGTYEYAQDVYDYLMKHQQRTRESLLAEVLERAINDDHKDDGVRTLVRKLRKGELAAMIAMVAEWESADRDNAQRVPLASFGEESPPARTVSMTWLEITPAGAAQLADHLRVGLQCSDGALRGFVEAFVQDLER